jgi:hypothetical protein
MKLINTARPGVLLSASTSPGLEWTADLTNHSDSQYAVSK